MTDHERAELLNEARHFYLVAPVLLPLLEKRKRITIEKLMAKHRDGDTRYETLVAELAVVNGIEQEIKSKEQMYRTLEESKNGSTKS